MIVETTPGNKSDQRRTEAKHSKKITTAITYASILTALAVPILSIPELKAKGDKNLKNTTEKTGILTGQAKAIETPKRPMTEEEDTELAIEKADSLAEKGDYENAIKILLQSITSTENPSQDIETRSSGNKRRYISANSCTKKQKGHYQTHKIEETFTDKNKLQIATIQELLGEIYRNQESFKRQQYLTKSLKSLTQILAQEVQKSL